MPERAATDIAQVRWDGRDYARHSTVQREFGEEHLAHLELAGTEAILDIGCGDGKLTAILAGKVPRGRVVGIDNSPDMIRTAEETQTPHHTNLSFQRIDATSMPFEDMFDVVFSTSSLHWIKDHVPVLAGSVRALKRNGRLYLVFGARGTVAAVVATMDVLIARPAWNDRFSGFELPFGLYGPEEYRTWLEALGLTIDTLEMIDRDVTHEGRDAFEGWFRNTWMPYIHRLEPAQRPAFIEQAVDLYLEQNPVDDQGRVHVKMVSLLVKARKALKTGKAR